MAWLSSVSIWPSALAAHDHGTGKHQAEGTGSRAVVFPWQESAAFWGQRHGSERLGKRLTCPLLMVLPSFVGQAANERDTTHL